MHHYSLAACAEAVLKQPGAPDYRERYASLPYACPIDGSPPACIYETADGYKTAREILDAASKCNFRRHVVGAR